MGSRGGLNGTFRGSTNWLVKPMTTPNLSTGVNSALAARTWCFEPTVKLWQLVLETGDLISLQEQAHS